MGNLIEIINKMREIDGDFNDGDRLTKFFGLLTRFNHDEPVDRKIMDSIESFFEYKWVYDCNHAIETQEDFMLLSQVPYSV